jgi:MFS family permease
LGVDGRGLGILTSAAGIGSVIGLISFGFVHSKMRPGTVIVLGLTLFALSLIGVAASRSFWLTWTLLVGTGMAHIYFQTSANVILQSLVDSGYRGRVMSLYGQLWSLMLLSGVILNGVAALTNASYALAGGAIVLLVFTYAYLARSTSLRNVELPDANPRAARH